MSDVETSVYVIAVEAGTGEGPVKIGISSNVGKRFRTLQTASPYKLGLVHEFTVPNRDIAREIEECFHAVQKRHRTVGEWFKLNPIIALQLMVMCIETLLSVRLPDFDEMDAVNEMCGLESARQKLKLWTAPRETLQ